MRVLLLLMVALGMVATASASERLPVDGVVVQQQSWTTNGSPGERWLAVISRTEVATHPTRYQYQLSFLRPRIYGPAGSQSRSGYNRVFVTPGTNPNGDFLTKFSVGPAFDQSVRIVGIYRGYLVVQKHESAGDCGSDEVALFSEPGDGDVEKDISVTNHCSLQATIVGAGAYATVVFSGPEYRIDTKNPANSDPICCPSVAHARATLIESRGHYSLQPNYFRLIAP